MKQIPEDNTLVFDRPVDARIYACLQEEDIRFNYDSEDHFFCFHISGKNCLWQMVVRFDEQHKVVVFRSAYPLVVNDVNKLRVAELLTRLNSAIVMGSYQLDFESGEVAFCIVHALSDDSYFDDNSFRRLLNVHIFTTDAHFVPIFSVNAGLSEPVTTFLELMK